MKKLIEQGNAYADDTPGEEMKDQRDAQTDSKYRNASVKDNLQRFKEMCAGNKKFTSFCIRAKMPQMDEDAEDYLDQAGGMRNKVGCLRDPVFYRCKDVAHHRTGDKFKAYPTYDFTCPIVDSIEGVTHALRTIEYRDRDELYKWVQEVLGMRKVEMYEFSKLNFKCTCLSKRKLKWFVENGHVSGWDDPRFPTVQGIMRRGMSVKALKDFMLEQGPSKNTNLMEWDKIWSINKSVLDPIAPRYTCIGKKSSARLTVTNGPETTVGRSHPLHGKEDLGHKIIFYGKECLIEHADAKTMKEGEKITMMQWGNYTISKIETDSDGKLHLTGTIDEADKNFKGTTKVTWLTNDPESIFEIEIKEYDHLITKDKIMDGDEPGDVFNKNSISSEICYAEGACRQIQKGCYLQMQRRGLYICDQIALINKQMVLNFIPDGSLSSMSKVGNQMDIKASAKGHNVVEKKVQEGAGLNEAGEKSKGAMNKEAAKAKKIAAKLAAKEGGEGAKAVPGQKPQMSQAAIDAKAAAALRAKNPYASGKKFDEKEAVLAKQNFLGGQQPNSEDAEFLIEFTSINKIPNVLTCPHLFAWYSFVSKFTQAIKDTWPASKKAPAVQKEEKKSSAAAGPVRNPACSDADWAALEKLKAAIVVYKKEKADKTKIDAAV